MMNLSSGYIQDRHLSPPDVWRAACTYARWEDLWPSGKSPGSKTRNWLAVPCVA